MSTTRFLYFILVFGGCSGQSATSTQASLPVAPVASTSATPVASAPAVQATPLAATVPRENSSASPVEISVPSATSSALASPSTSESPRRTHGSIRGKIITHPTQAAQNAVVYLENAPVDKIVDAKLDDHKMTFVPFVSVMTVGGTLTYVNSEPFPDTAFSMSNEKWDFGMVASHGARKRKFEHPGNYTVLCRLHPNQLAFLIVTPSSYFARADKKGEFVVQDVPEGTYELVAWAPRVKSDHKSVTIAGSELAVDFELKR